ncbi:hypothetical protein [Phycicoccus sp. Soil748]|uniref:hypothetical protein n=1 Tax=Phycicoccus sp. Soil748 TaxID=1736397 RepID=UPI000703B868|nr:hypothetical protein [Phycicoccus sp. Soil748]KRE52678.1 hypothetical protein ASG70_15045 [Phycicoccus sp. Soil748]
MKTLDQLPDRTLDPRDPFALLVAARPTDDDLTDDWGPADVEDTLASTRRRADPQHTSAGRTVALVPRRSRRRWVALGAAAAVATLAVAGGTAVLAPGTALPRADAVEQLASTAAVAPTLVVGPGQYLHQVVTFTQAHRDAQTPAVDSTSESWVDADGTAWRRDTSRVEPVGTTYERIPASDLGDDPFMGTQPADYQQWPSDPAGLRAFFDAHLRSDGPNSLDPSQAIFEDCSDRFAQGMTPPALNAAMIRLLGSLPQVTTSRVQFAGHDAVELEYRGAYVDAVYFDAATARYLGETDSGNRTEVTVQPTVVDSVPAVVRARAKTQVNEDAPDSVESP